VAIRYPSVCVRDPVINPDIPLGGAKGLHEPCRILSVIWPADFLANSEGSCFVKGANICS